jgi:hypothetical protein
MIITIFLNLFLLVNSFCENPKYCANCKFFNPPKNNLFKNDNLFGTCLLFPLNNYDEILIGKNNRKYAYCTTSRLMENMCGKYAKKYKEKDNI